MKGIEAYLSYASKVGMVPEFHYPFLRSMEFLARGKPSGPLTPVLEVHPLSPEIIVVRRSTI